MKAFALMPWLFNDMIKYLADVIPIIRAVHAWYAKRRELPVSRSMAAEMRLENYLIDQGLILKWSSVDLVEHRLRHQGYKRIMWTAPESKRRYVLVNYPGCDYPLAYPIDSTKD